MSTGRSAWKPLKPRPVFDGDQLRALDIEEKNRAKEIIEDFMVAANGVTARYLSAKGFPSIRRVVRTPKRWDRIVAIAAERKAAAPGSSGFESAGGVPDQGESRRSSAIPRPLPGRDQASGFGRIRRPSFLAGMPRGTSAWPSRTTAHSTAPNRRYPDLLTQRLLKAAIAGQPAPYREDELDDLAAHCTEAEDEATKVERQVDKSAAALLLEFEDRRAVRFDRHRRVREGHLGPPAHGSGRRQACSGI